MSRDLDREHREMETASSRRETSSPLEVDSSRCGPEHGLRERTSGDEPPARDTRPDRATRFDFRASERKLSFQRFFLLSPSLDTLATAPLGATFATNIDNLN